MKEKVKGQKETAAQRSTTGDGTHGAGGTFTKRARADKGTVRKEKEAESGAAMKSRRQARSQRKLRNEGKDETAAPEPVVAKRTKSEAMREHWRQVRAGLVPNNHHPEKGPTRSVNPLFDLPERERAKLFAWLRECPYDDAVQQMLREHGLKEASSSELNDFFQFEAEQHWEKRILRAAQEANALVQLAEKSPVRFSSGILAALGQEAFRQIASGQVEPEAMGKLATLFLKARSDERADQMQELKREKLRHELQDQIDHALDKLAEEVERNPAAREAFDALRKELATSMEERLGGGA